MAEYVIRSLTSLGKTDSEKKESSNLSRFFEKQVFLQNSEVAGNTQRDTRVKNVILDKLFKLKR